jgi:hypothetical protein
MKPNLGMLHVSADDVRRLPTACLHDRENSETIRHEILSGADAHRVGREIGDCFEGKQKPCVRHSQGK